MLKQKLRRYYANINLHLFEMAKLMDQGKQNIIFWINQKDQPNPADKLENLILIRKTWTSEWF